MHNLAQRSVIVSLDQEDSDAEEEIAGATR
jgi:hypothetical protein